MRLDSSNSVIQFNFYAIRTLLVICNSSDSLSIGLRSPLESAIGGTITYLVLALERSNEDVYVCGVDSK